MKQHITIEQLKEIKSIEQFVELYRMVRPNKKISDKRIVNFYLDIINNYGFGPNKLLSEISIGKMIEILEIRTKSHIEIIYLRKQQKWNIKLIEFDELVIEETEIEFETKELCNALWKVVKFVFREND